MARSAHHSAFLKTSQRKLIRNAIDLMRLEPLENRQMLSGSAVTFLPAVDAGVPISVQKVVLADLNNDGKLDLVSMAGASHFTPAQLAVTLGNGDGTFAHNSSVFTISGLSPDSAHVPAMAVGDLNHDGKMDIAAVNFVDNAFYVFTGNGDGTFQNPVRVGLSTSIIPTGIGIGDFNGDGYADAAVVAGTSTSMVMSWGGPGAFPASQNAVTLPQGGYDINVADFDQDGVMDVGIAGSNSYTVVEKLNQPTPTFSSVGGINSGYGIVGSAVGNLLGPGQAPSAALAQTNGVNNSRFALIPRPAQDGTITDYSSGTSLGAIAVADFNRDGYGDVLLGIQNPGNGYQIELGNGDGTIDTSTASAVSTSFAVYDIAVGDLNGDGYPDAVMASGGAQVMIQSAPSLVVTTTVDEDNGNSSPALGTGTSLREALNYARTLGGPQTITFAPALGNANAVVNVTGNIMSLFNNSNITIQNNTGHITINGNGQNTGFWVRGGGTLTLRNVTISGFASSIDDQGGAVYVDSGGALNVDSVTFANNSAAQMGGAIFSQPSSNTTIRNSTFYGNSNAALALDASSGGSVTLENDTIANNNGGGLRVLGGTIALRNDIIANNNGTDVSINGGALTGNNNIIRTGSTSGLTGTITADPMLNAATDNGGFTNTMSLQLGSPAINAGATLGTVTTDERGIARPLNGAYDIGAFEARIGASPTLNPNTLNVNVQAQPVNLAQATNPSPSGGTFNGAGVSNGVFNPSGLPLGQKTITYTLPLASGFDLPGSTTLTINVVATSVATSANVSMSLSTQSPLEGTPFTVNVKIANIVDQFGNPFVPSSGSITLSPQTVGDQTITLTAQQLAQGSFTVPFNVIYPQNGGIFTIHAAVTLDSLQGGSDAFVNIGNVAPSNLQLNGASSIAQGASYSLSGSFVDPGTWDAHSVTIDWGDGSAATVLNRFAGVLDFAANKTYAGSYGDNSNYTISVTVDDGNGGLTTTTMPILITRSNQLFVTTTADEDNGTSDANLGAGTSLREALHYAEQHPGPDTITFAPNLAGQTITLGNGWNDSSDDTALRIASDVTIQGNGEILSGAGSRRQLIVENSGSATLNNLTFSNGAGDFGGAIRNFGSLTISNCTFASNHASTDGGAVHSATGSVLLSLQNCTFADNSSASASAITTAATSNSWDHLTIADNAGGAAFDIYETSVMMRNSIVARNGNDGAITDLGAGTGTFSASSTNNVVGGGSWQGLNPASNKLNFNAASLHMGTLADNGGLTKTVALLPGSAAINHGDDADALQYDQRGQPRIFGSHSDIGAFELQSNQVNGIWNGYGDASSWSNPLNWSNDVVPGNADDALIDIPASVSVTASGLVRVKSLTLNGSSELSLAAGGSKLLWVDRLLITGGATLDLADHDMIVDYASGSNSALSTVADAIRNARNGGAWSGTGLTSSVAAANAQHNTSLGAIEASDYMSISGVDPLFDGQPIDDSAVLVKYTYYGDTDFNGKVDGGDYARVDINFNREHTTGNISGWFNGDFDGNGKVDGGDYGLIDYAFNTQGTALRPAYNPVVSPIKSPGKLKLLDQLQ